MNKEQYEAMKTMSVDELAKPFHMAAYALSNNCVDLIDLDALRDEINDILDFLQEPAFDLEVTSVDQEHGVLTIGSKNDPTKK